MHTPFEQTKSTLEKITNKLSSKIEDAQSVVVQIKADREE